MAGARQQAVGNGSREVVGTSGYGQQGERGRKRKQDCLRRLLKLIHQ